jgi:putative FmdB family regulatory protein
MPTYEYECPIHQTIEVQQSISDPILEECPQCLEDGKHTPVQKLISLSSFQLSGGGWAKEGYS